MERRKVLVQIARSVAPTTWRSNRPQARVRRAAWALAWLLVLIPMRPVTGADGGCCGGGVAGWYHASGHVSRVPPTATAVLKLALAPSAFPTGSSVRTHVISTLGPDTPLVRRMRDLGHVGGVFQLFWRFGHPSGYIATHLLRAKARDAELWRLSKRQIWRTVRRPGWQVRLIRREGQQPSDCMMFEVREDATGDLGYAQYCLFAEQNVFAYTFTSAPEEGAGKEGAELSAASERLFRRLRQHVRRSVSGVQTRDQ